MPSYLKIKRVKIHAKYFVGSRTKCRGYMIFLEQWKVYLTTETLEKCKIWFELFYWARYCHIYVNHEITIYTLVRDESLQ